jgi:hypothetical protein
MTTEINGSCSTGEAELDALEAEAEGAEEAAEAGVEDALC